MGAKCSLLLFLVNKVLPKHRGVHLFTYCHGEFLLQWQSWGVATNHRDNRAYSIYSLALCRKSSPAPSLDSPVMCILTTTVPRCCPSQLWSWGAQQASCLRDFAYTVPSLKNTEHPAPTPVMSLLPRSFPWSSPSPSLLYVPLTASL